MLKKFANNAANGLVNNFTFANIITLIGLIADLWNNYLIHNGITGFLPLILLWFVPFTDFLDGLLARWRKAETWVGETLDPVRDKVYSCSKFIFMVLSFIALSPNHELMAPLAIIVYSLLAVVEISLFVAGVYGLIKGYKVKANLWGKRKMAVECFILSIIWGPVFLISPWGITLDNVYVLITLAILPIFPIYLALKSLEGHISAFKKESQPINSAVHV